MSDEIQFEEGDKVAHKSGGPVLVVNEILPGSQTDDGRPSVRCRWWDEDDDSFRVQLFIPAELEEAESLDAPF